MKDEGLDYDYCLINVNGFAKDENYVLRAEDVCTIRQFPSDDRSSNYSRSDNSTAAGIADWILNPIGSFFYGCTTGDWGGYGVFTGIVEKAESKGTEETETVKAVEETTDKTIQTLPTVSGATNTSASNTTVPLFLGKSLYAPRVLQSFTSIGGTDGEDQYLNLLYMAGYSPLKLEEMNLGLFNLIKNESIEFGKIIDVKKDLKNGLRYEDIQLEITDGGECSLAPVKVVQENLENELFYYKFNDNTLYSVPLFSAKNPSKVEIEFTCDGLVSWDNGGKKGNAEVDVKIEYSFDNTNWNVFSQIGKDTEYSTTTGITKIVRQQAKTLRFTASRIFSYQDLYNSNGTSKMTESVIYLRITRTNEQNISNDNVVDTIKVSAIRTTVYDRAKTESQTDTAYADRVLVPQVPVIRSVADKTVRIAMKIKATESNKDVMKEFNFVGTSIGRVWDSEEGEWKEELEATQNPASCALIVMQGSHRGDDVYADSEIDLEALGRFYEFCEDESRNFKCNGVVLKRTKTEELLKNVYRTGRGFRVLNGLLQSVCWDDYKTNVVNIINNQNCISATNSKNLEELPDGYICRFQDERNYYQETEYIVCYDDDDLTRENLKLESLSIDFVTDSAQMYKLVKYICACRKLRRESWSRKLSVDGNLIEIGNLVELQDDTILVGIGSGAEITEVVVEEGYITKIKVDDPFEISDAGKTYGVKIMQADGVNEPTVIKKQIVNRGVGLYSELEFTDSISVQSTIQPCVEDIVSFGEFSKITIDAICSSKKENSDGTFDFVFVPYDEAIYEADTQDIPDFDSKVTSPSGRQAITFSSEANLATMNDVDRSTAKVQVTDDNGNTWISNSQYAPITAVQIQGIVYQLNNSTKDEEGGNAGSLTFSGEFKNESFFDNQSSFNGTIEKDIGSTDGDTVILTNASKIKIGDKVVTCNGNVDSDMNSIASTSWGLTDSQISSDIFD